MKLDILVPTSLREITLEQYQKFDLINKEENKDTSFLMHKAVEIFCHLDLRNIASIRYKHVATIMEDINKVFEQKPKFRNLFVMDGIQYGFIPVLDDMTLGEYIDLDNTLSDWEQMHKAMAVLYRPVTKIKNDKYQIQEYEGSELANTMKKMPLDIVMGSLIFFYNLSNELLKTTLSYLNKEGKKTLTIQQREALAKSGIGISPYMLSVKEMLPNLMKLQD